MLLTLKSTTKTAALLLVGLLAVPALTGCVTNDADEGVRGPITGDSTGTSAPLSETNGLGSTSLQIQHLYGDAEKQQKILSLNLLCVEGSAFLITTQTSGSTTINSSLARFIEKDALCAATQP